MVELFTAVYMFCTMSIADPNIAGPDVANMFPREAITEQEPKVKKEQLIIIDYVEELKKLGYYKKISKDEKLNLRMAVNHFQSDHNISLSGQWNNECLSALKKRLKTETFEYMDTVEAPPTKDKWITINKTKHILTLYKGSNIVKKYPVAIGKSSTPSPDGKYTIVCKVIDPAWGGGGYAKPIKGGAPNNPLGKRWLGLSLNGGGDYGIHGNADEYSIGKSVSHGCIRMHNADVLELYDLVNQSTPVWLANESELKQWGVKQPVYADKE
ncbi:MAG: L,D-transpeptidase [Clostridia bacterium]|nr:L,D-transpeptidase [Clostridia bacterium]